MKYGVVFPTNEIGGDPGAVRDYTVAAEDLGFVRLTAYDHVLGAVQADRDPPLPSLYDEHDPFHEPLTLLSFMAAITEQIELATGVLVLPQRQTALVAKQIAELDLLSGGRAVLGVGTGWNHVEYTALGMTFGDRGRRFDEQIDVLRSLWTGKVVDYTGAYHAIERVSIAPAPGRRIPILMGGVGEPALVRAASVGDGFILAGYSESHFASAQRLADLLEANGRDGGAFHRDMFFDFASGADEWAQLTGRWSALGGSTMSLRTQTNVPEARLSGVGEHIAALEVFMREMR